MGELVKICLFISFFCYLFVSIFLFVGFYKTKLKVFWNKIKIIFLLGFIFHSIAFFLYWENKKHFPVTTISESIFLLGWLLVPIILFIEYRNKDIIMNTVLMPLVLISVLNILLHYPNSFVLNPVLKSSWIFIHVPVSLLGFFFLFVSFGASIMYLIQERAVKAKKYNWMYVRLPSMQESDSINYYCIILGFIFISLGIITGILWSKTAFNKFWQWDIKEILTAFTWVVYAILLFSRKAMKRKGRFAAYFSIAAFLLVLITFFGFALIAKSYHKF